MYLSIIALLALVSVRIRGALGSDNDGRGGFCVLEYFLVFQPLFEGFFVSWLRSMSIDAVMVFALSTFNIFQNSVCAKELSI